MQGICTYNPETNYVPREYSVAAILLLQFMVLISIVIIIIIIIIIYIDSSLLQDGGLGHTVRHLGEWLLEVSC